MMSDDLSLLGCLRKLEDRTKQGAIEFLRCLKTQGIIVYWSDAWGKLIARSKSGHRGSWKSFMKEVMVILEIRNKEDWVRIKRKYEL